MRLVDMVLKRGRQAGLVQSFVRPDGNSEWAKRFTCPSIQEMYSISLYGSITRPRIRTSLR
jgi:hypothetical protein